MKCGKKRKKTMVFKKDTALQISKHGVDMLIYNDAGQCGQAAVAYQETETGHAEEFLHEKNAFVFYIIEGSGTWVIEDREYDAAAGDVVIVPPGKRFWYRGALKQVCVTAPAWDGSFERHIRTVEL